MPEPTTPSYRSNPVLLVRPGFQGISLNFVPLVGLTAFFFGTSIIAVVLVTLIAGQMSASTLGSNAGATPFLSLILLAAVLICLMLVIFTPPVTRLILAMARQQKTSLREMMADVWRVGLRLLWVQLLMGLAILGGFILFIIPGIIFLGWFALAPYVAVDEGLGGLAALRRSRELARGRIFEVWGALSLQTLANIFMVVPVIGNITALVLSLVLVPVLAIRYDELKKLKHDKTGHTAVRVDPWNYALIVLALVALILGTPNDEVVIPVSVLNPPVVHKLSLY